jgi:hypothetical protein
MSKVSRDQKILKWFENEKVKDDMELESYRKKIIGEIRGVKKDEIFSKNKKMSLWERIKLVILGQ